MIEVPWVCMTHRFLVRRAAVSQMMMNDPRLHAHVRDAIQSGKLPNRRPDRMWGGRGVGDACAVCDQPVTRKELEFELHFERADDPAEVDTIHVHIGCFMAWEMERAA